ncbi:MAG: EAL domain-containing protein, partial [Cyanobacteria bacterium J06642_11]
MRNFSLWAKSIREGFSVLFPLTIVGASCQGFLIPYSPYRLWMDNHFGAHWDFILQLVQTTTIGSMGLFSSIAISGCLLRQLDINWSRRNSLTTLSTGIIAACLFLVMVVPYSDFEWSTLGYGNLFQGVFAGLITAELLNCISQYESRRHTHFLGLADVFQHNSKNTVIFGIALFLVGGVGYLFSLMQGWVYELLIPLSAWITATSTVSTLPFHIVLVILNQLLWEIGFNGGQILLSLLSSSSLIDPETLSSAAPSSASITFVNSFAHLGGAGATWGLIVAIFVKGRDPTLRKLAWLALLPAIINVNEPLLLGIPLIFRPAWFLPFIGAPIINCIITHAVMMATGTHLVIGESLWSTPIFLSGYLLTESWVGPVAQLLSILTNTFMYFPYVVREEQHRHRTFKQQFEQSISFLSAPESVSENYLDRPDHHGDVARRLLNEFKNDLGTSSVYLVYQPIHDKDHDFVYAEALLRWTHAEYGNISPAAIINIVEDSDFIHTMGEWVIHQASKDITYLKLAGHKTIKVAVNIS